jgi:hypothetical protein
MRPGGEFEIPDDGQPRAMTYAPPICRPCREKLWDNPDDAGEICSAVMPSA